MDQSKFIRQASKNKKIVIRKSDLNESLLIDNTIIEFVESGKLEMHLALEIIREYHKKIKEFIINQKNIIDGKFIDRRKNK